MKKAFSLILALVLCLVLCACGRDRPTGTNNSTTVSPDNAESDEERMQKLIDYNKAVDLLDSLDADFSADQIETMNTAYSLLLSLGDYKDASDLLSCFIECICKNENGSYTVYDKNGTTLVETTFGGTFRCSYEYNDNGQVIRTDYTSSRKSYYVTYEYYADGNVATRYSSGYKTASGSM